MEIFGKDIIIGPNFKSSDFGLITVSSENKSGESSDDVFKLDTETVYLGESPSSKFIKMNYSDALQATVTFMKDPCDRRASDNKWMTFTEKECRAIVRVITGNHGFQWMRIIPEDMTDTEEIWYKVTINNVKYNRINSDIYTITIEITADSFMGYTPEITHKLSLTANKEKSMYIVTDDLNNYVQPVLKIIPKSSGTLNLTNRSDGSGWTTTVKSVSANSTITFDCQNKLLTGATLNNFNLHWPRLVADKNTYISNITADLEFVYRAPLKAGWIAR